MDVCKTLVEHPSHPVHPAIIQGRDIVVDRAALHFAEGSSVFFVECVVSDIPFLSLCVSSVSTLMPHRRQESERTHRDI